MISSAYQKMTRRFLADTGGNFGMMTAILLPVLLGFAGAGMELANVMQVKADLQNTADSAALAAATEARLKEGALTDEQIKEIAKAFIASQMEKTLTDEEKKALEKNSPVNIGTTDDARGKTYTIQTTINYQMQLNPLFGFFGAKTLDLAATGTAVSTVNKGAPISMYLVLDRSGSMSFKTDTVDTSKIACPVYTEKNWGQSEARATSQPCYVTKIASLKTAVNFLVDTLNQADPTYQNGTSELVRLGAVAYNSNAFAAQAITWGTRTGQKYVTDIPEYPTGGTDASAAMRTATAALVKTNITEANQHTKKGNESFERYIVLMTDGEMNSTTIDSNVRATCKTAKAEGIKIFTVAFMAPPEGKKLLQFCASSAENYYEPESKEQIVTAFGQIARKAAGSLATLTN
ncbi:MULTISPECIES: vWA domain-containing protein [unclassified Rhizobium]|uniref:vWA domain-containing protein n=1 Tax=unclassified Rhizobium TaxID=2613769 RepID=UPI000BD4083D|nr:MULTISPECIES: TadE/TadG family type IV pilus assembly protein [unclassified Rhizobium]MDH7809918.1 Flp pilus assembly protein TadG/uncharacterized protein YegL [Rhizobium sp. AN67]SOD52795.1 Flp pilus assembly protein TadG [Rhizobium sp. AN6A]